MAEEQHKHHLTIRERAGRKYLYIEQSIRDENNVNKTQKKNLGRIFDEFKISQNLKKIAQQKTKELKLKNKNKINFIALYSAGFEIVNNYLIYYYPEKRGKDINTYKLVYDFENNKLFRLLKTEKKERERKRNSYDGSRQYIISAEGIKPIAISTKEGLVY